MDTGSPCEDTRSPLGSLLRRLEAPYGNAKGKAFTEEEDRFVVCMCHQLVISRPCL